MSKLAHSSRVLKILTLAAGVVWSNAALRATKCLGQDFVEAAKSPVAFDLQLSAAVVMEGARTGGVRALSR